MTDDRIAKILDWLAERVTKAESFVLEQAPDVVRQIVTMDVAMAIYGVAVFGVILVATILVARWVWRITASWSDAEDREITRAVTATFATLTVIGMIVGIGCNARTIVKARVAPKAYLLERVGVLK